MEKTNRETTVGEEGYIFTDATPAQFNTFLSLVTTESLFKCMHKLVEREDYENAAFYRNELIRRGEL